MFFLQIFFTKFNFIPIERLSILMVQKPRLTEALLTRAEKNLPEKGTFKHET